MDMDCCIGGSPLYNTDRCLTGYSYHCSFRWSTVLGLRKGKYGAAGGQGALGSLQTGGCQPQPS